MESTKYECRICMLEAIEPVVTTCGHMFCWSCLDKWLNQNQIKLSCPVCKSGISREKLIPLFLNEETKDPRSENPRPQPSRELPTDNPNYSRFSTFQTEGGATVGFGPSLTSAINSMNIMNHNDQRADTLSKLMLIIGLVILLSVLI